MKVVARTSGLKQTVCTGLLLTHWTDVRRRHHKRMMYTCRTRKEVVVVVVGRGRMSVVFHSREGASRVSVASSIS